MCEICKETMKIIEPYITDFSELLKENGEEIEKKIMKFSSEIMLKEKKKLVYAIACSNILMNTFCSALIKHNENRLKHASIELIKRHLNK